MNESTAKPSSTPFDSGIPVLTEILHIDMDAPAASRQTHDAQGSVDLKDARLGQPQPAQRLMPQLPDQLRAQLQTQIQAQIEAVVAQCVSDAVQRLQDGLKKEICAGLHASIEAMIADAVVQARFLLDK